MDHATWGSATTQLNQELTGAAGYYQGFVFIHDQLGIQLYFYIAQDVLQVDVHKQGPV